VSQPRADLARTIEKIDPGSTLAPMPGDASLRRFWRMRRPDGTTRVIMDYGEPFEENPADVVVARILSGAGLPCAAIDRVVPEVGILVVEDLGNRTLEREVHRCQESGESVAPLYEAAVDLAVRVAQNGTLALAASTRADGPVLDPSRFRFEMSFFAEHFVEGWLGADAGDRLRRELRDLAECAAAATRRRVLCHRDFHSRNLMVLPDGSLAMVDIQDARWGPDTYDLASLLRDAYVDLPPALVEAGLARYWAAIAPDEKPAEFRSRFDLVALQRMVKALGTFGYKASVQGATSYLEGVPRTVGRILSLRERLTSYPALYGVLASVPETRQG
jgi:aminoglycoside/choline kinase family phosphotransferase